MKALDPIQEIGCGSVQLRAMEAGRPKEGLVVSIQVRNSSGVVDLRCVALALPEVRQSFAEEFAPAAGVPVAEMDSILLNLHEAVEVALRTKSAKPDTEEGKPGAGIDLEAREPWPNPVDGAALAEDIRTAFEHYVILPAGAAIALTLWLFASWLHYKLDLFPFVLITSATKRCGKSLLKEVMFHLSLRAVRMVGITSSTLFRLAEEYRPTMLIDEADRLGRDNPGLLAIVNASYTRRDLVPRVEEVRRGRREPRFYNPFGPRVLVGIGSFPDTITDRGIAIRMRRKGPGEKVSPFRARFAGPLLDELAGKLARWAADNCSVFDEVAADPPRELNDRAQDNWEPLCRIAALLGEEWPNRAHAAALALVRGEPEGDDVGEMLIRDIREAFDEMGTDRMSSEDLVAYLRVKEDRPWQDWSRGAGLSKAALARLLGRFEIRPKTIRMGGGATLKGYMREQFAQVFDAYSHEPPLQTVTPSQPMESKENLSIPGRHNGPPVTAREVDIAEEDQRLLRRDGSRPPGLPPMGWGPDPEGEFRQAREWTARYAQPVWLGFITAQDELKSTLARYELGQGLPEKYAAYERFRTTIVAIRRRYASRDAA